MLHTGDARAILPTLAAHSVDAVVLTPSRLPFPSHVAAVAERHNVIEGVGVVDRHEVRHGAEMMHVELPPQVALADAAVLASVLIPLARGPSHGAPIWPVVRTIPTAPRWITGATQRDVRASMRTEAASVARRHSTRAALYMNPTRFALVFHQRAPRLTGACGATYHLPLHIWPRDYPFGDTQRAALVMAGPRAKDGAMLHPRDLARRRGGGCSACAAGQNGRQCPVLCSVEIRTRAAACSLPSVSQSLRVG